MPNDNSQSTISQDHLIYGFAHCETWLEDYAKSNRLSTHEFTERVAELLLVQTRGSVLGVDDTVSALRRNGTSRGKTARSVEVDVSTHSKTPRRVTASGRPNKRYNVQWTPKRRREYALRMKRHQHKLQAARQKAIRLAHRNVGD